MTQSDSPDFEFDVSDLEVEGNDPSTSERGRDASEAEGDSDQADRSQVAEDQGVEDNSFSVSSSNEDDVELSGFDLDGLPDSFSSVPARPSDATADGGSSESVASGVQGESSEEPSSARPVESESPPRSLREMGPDDLGADVFAEIDDEDEIVSFEDVLEDLMEQVDDFEAGGFVDLDEEAEREAASGEAGDGIFGIEDPDDSLSQSVDPNAEPPKTAKKPEAAEPLPRPKLPMDFEIPADPIAEEPPSVAAAEAGSESVSESSDSRPTINVADESESRAPSVADEVSEDDSLDEDDLAAEVVSAYESLEESDPEESYDDEAIEADEHVNIVEESPVLVDDEEADEAAADNQSSEVVEPEDAVDDEWIEEELADEVELPHDEVESPDPLSDEEVEASGGGETEDADEEDLSQLAEALEEDSAEGVEPGLEVLEDDEEEELLGESEASSSGPSLAILDDDEEEEEEEELVEPTAGSEELADETPDEGSEILEPDEDEDEIVSMPSADDLLMRAGDILNGGKPADAARSMLEGVDEDDEEEIAEMPSPLDLMAEAIDPDDEVVAMPDPTEIMKMAAGQTASADAGAEKPIESPAPVSGNVADRAGDLPPPPPAPVEIIDDDPMEEDDAAPEPMAEMEPLGSELDAQDFQDPFESEISLDDFDESFGGSDDLGDIFPDEVDISGSEDGDDSAAAAKGDGAKVVAMPKPSLLWRVTHSLAVAAAVFAIAAGWIFTIWKQQIVEYLDGRDIDGSALVMQIRQIGSHALQDFDEYGLYRMQWVDSEVRRVAKNEIRIHALVGAQLRENLYEPVFDSELDKKFGYDETPLMDAVEYASAHYPEEIGRHPKKPWNRLYRISAPKSEVLPLRVVYRLTREDDESDWALTGVKVRGHEKDEVEWPEGQPAHAFGDHAYDIDSLEFRRVLAEYQEKTEAYVANISHLRHGADEKLAALQVENQKRRERVMMSLSQGTFFSGVAIVGEDAATAEDVTMVITEIREKGALVKGVFQMDKRTDDYSKFFVGSIDFEPAANGSEQGVLNLRTVAMSNAPADDSESAFFDPQTVSRMRLKTDGFRLEGDMRDLSLRLTRNM